MSEIQNLNEPWDGLHNGDEIEAFLKKQLQEAANKPNGVRVNGEIVNQDSDKYIPLNVPALADTLGDDNTKAMSQKGVTDVVAPLNKKMASFFGESSVTFTWTASKKLMLTNGKADVQGTANVSVAKVDVEGFQNVVFNIYKAALSAGSGTGYLWMFTSADGTAIETGSPIAIKTGTHALEELEKSVPANAKWLYMMTNTSYTSNIYVKGTSFIIPQSIQDKFDSIDEDIISVQSGVSGLQESIVDTQGDIAANANAINGIEAKIEGLEITGFLANKYIVGSDTLYGNYGTANGYARGPVMTMAIDYGTLQILNVPSNATINLFAYSSTETMNHSTCCGFTTINRTFDPLQVIAQNEWTDVAAIQLSMTISSGTELSQEVVDTYLLKRLDTLANQIGNLENNVGDLQEQVADLVSASKKGIFHYNATPGGMSYVSSNIANNTIKANFRIARTGAPWSNGNNPQFNFSSVELNGSSVHSCSEEATPSKFNYSYLGGNHGDSAIRNVSAANHGKTYADIGSTWKFMRGSTAVYLTLIGIRSENSLVMIGTNSSQYPKWHFTALNTNDAGTITHVDGATNREDITFTAVSVGQLRNAMIIVNRGVYVDGKEVTESGDYPFSKLQICENYDILNTADIVRKIQEKVGTFTANPDFPELGADKVARHSLVYTFVGADLWFINKTLTFFQDVNIVSGDESLFVMSQIISGSSIKMYIPKALPVNNIDFRSIANYGSVSQEMTIPTSKWENPLLPPDRYLQYSTAIGHETGYLFDYGIGGNNRKDCISNAFSLPTTRKVYPIGIDNSVSYNARDSYSAVSFRKYFLPSSIDQNGVICCNVFEYDDKLYIYADYNAAGLYEIDIPSKYLGKKVEVFEARSNVKLLTKVSSSKLIVKVDEVEEGDVMYGYLVAQIK